MKRDSDPRSGRGRGRNRKGRAGRPSSNNKRPPTDKPTAPEKAQQETPPSVEELKQQEEARKLAEEEARKLAEEQEQRKLEEARKAQEAKQLQDRNQNLQDACQLLQSTIETIEKHVTYRKLLQEDDLQKFRKEFEANKKSLKTDLKKCTAFVKKIKTGNAWSMKPQDIINDVATLNLSRYVDEVVAGIQETPPKVADFPVIIALCVAMHQRYPEFVPNLLDRIISILQKSSNVENSKLRRVYIRLLAEFILNGLTKDTRPLVKCVNEATGVQKDGTYQVQDAHLVVAFCKGAGVEILDVLPKSLREAHELMQKEASVPDGIITPVAQEVMVKFEALKQERAVPQDISEALVTSCTGAYHAIIDTYIETNRKLQKLEKRCAQDRLLSGSLSETREKGLIDARKLCENMQKSVEALSDALDLALPQLQEEYDEEDAKGGIGVEVIAKGTGDNEKDNGPFDDEETRIFYCDIPDFLATIPPGLLGLTPEAIEARKVANAKKYAFESSGELDGNDGQEDPLSSLETLLVDKDEEETKVAGDTPTDNTTTTDSKINKDTPHYKLMVFLEEELPECHRREQIDELSEKFSINHGSSKNARKRLSKTMFLVPRTRIDLIPFYSRMAATLDRIWPDIAEVLLTELEQQFHGQAKFKKDQNLEARLRTAKFIGELTKFRVAPPIIFLRCLRRCLDDFTGSNVDVACCLLESCGRFLYRLPHTNPRLSALMETMIRLSKAKNLDDRCQGLIKVAFYSVKPPPSGPKKQAKKYPPLEMYLRHLLMVRLSHKQRDIKLVTKQLLRLPWSDPAQDCGALVSKLMMKACRKGRYKVIEAIAAVASSLRRHPGAVEASVRLIDSVLEQLRWAMEIPDFKDQQRNITYARLLGELFCSGMLSVNLIMRQLFDFINIGHEIPDALREASRRLAQKEEEEKIPASFLSTGPSRTIQEDEEMADEDIVIDVNQVATVESKPVAVSEYSKYDPRVPTPSDPPNAAYRIKLVCSVLEVVAKALVSSKNFPRLNRFLAAFQRYLFTKTSLPSDAEFTVLDTFDMMDSQWRKHLKNAKDVTTFPRYLSWLEAHNATVAFEEHEAKEKEEDRKRHLDAVDSYVDFDGSVASGSLVDDQGSLLEDEESIAQSMADADDAEESDSDMNGLEGDEHSHISQSTENDEEDFSDEDGANEDEEGFDEEAHMQQVEEEAFERELRRIQMEAYEKGKNTSRKILGDTMVSGSHFIRKKPNEKTNAEALNPFSLDGKSCVPFQLLRKGAKGKLDTRQLFVPSDTNLAQVATKHDDEAAREHDVIKQRVLQYEAESAEAGYSNVYLESDRLQVIRNRPLSLEDIDRNFGTSRGNARTERNQSASNSISRGTVNQGRTVAPGRGGRGRGRTSSTGRMLM